MSHVVGATGKVGQALPELALTTTKLSEEGRDMVDAISSRARRRYIPIRNSFVRASSSDAVPPLALLAKTKGRGGDVKLKLYLGLVWLSASSPYDTDIPASAWAALLDLDDPAVRGARRVRKAMSELEQLGLVMRELIPGSTYTVVLLREDGSRRAYSLPSTLHRSRRRTRAKDDLYFKIPVLLWETGHIQRMSNAALTMLLIIIEESRGKNDPQWWTASTFTERFKVSKDVRARGTKELVSRELIEVDRQAVASAPSLNPQLSIRRSRNTYRVINEAIGNKRP